MSTVRVGEANDNSIAAGLSAGITAGLNAGLGDIPKDLPKGTDWVELVLCLLLGATILRCFYARICKRDQHRKDKAQ